jgi:uncharacterized membrane protein YGL010W
MAPMAGIEQNLTQYAAYHRDRRNIATHFVGVPMIVFAVVLALAVVSFGGGSPGQSVTITLAAVASVAACIYYFRLDFGLGLTMAVTLFVFCAASSEITHRWGNGMALSIAAAVFVVGWIIQFVGHKFEGVKPAFFDDVKQLLIGPLFVAAEAAFLLGMRAPLRRYIEDRVGPTVPRRDGRPIPIRDEATAGSPGR